MPPDTVSAPAPAETAASYRTVWVLAGALAFAMTGTSLVMTVSALAGQLLAVDKRLATLPLALQFLATMGSTVPAALLMRRIGRARVFMIGQASGALAAVVCAVGLVEGAFVLFCIGSAGLGIHNAIWQYYRFAAADASRPEFKSRAISLVLAGGVVAALVGPELAKVSHELIAPATFAGSFLAVAALCATAVGVLAFARIPLETAEERRESGRPLGEILRQPAVGVAIAAAMIGYAVMSLVMTATPLAMAHHDHTFPEIAEVIRWHVLGMFGPSFFTGHLIHRFGALAIITVGIGLNLACVAINLAGIEVAHFWAGLMLLGIGWNFMYIGGTTLLTEGYRTAERSKVQAFNDLMIWGCVTTASFSSGVLQNLVGWQAVNAGVIVPVLGVLTATVWLWTRRKAA